VFIPALDRTPLRCERFDKQIFNDLFAFFIRFRLFEVVFKFYVYKIKGKNKSNSYKLILLKNIKFVQPVFYF